jgi:hypothetical protein
VCFLLGGIWSIGAAMLLRPALGRWLQRTRVWAATIAVNSVIMTLFLWHMTAFLLAVLLLWPLGFGNDHDSTPRWWMERPLWIAVPALILVGLVAIFGRFERLGRPARPRLKPGNAQARRGVGPRCAPPIGAARGVRSTTVQPAARHRIRDPGRDRLGHRVRRVCDLRHHAGLAVPAGVAAGGPTTWSVHLAREVHRVRRADGQLADRGGVASTILAVVGS